MILDFVIYKNYFKFESELHQMVIKLACRMRIVFSCQKIDENELAKTTQTTLCEIDTHKCDHHLNGCIVFVALEFWWLCQSRMCGRYGMCTSHRFRNESASRCDYNWIKVRIFSDMFSCEYLEMTRFRHQKKTVEIYKKVSTTEWSVTIERNMGMAQNLISFHHWFFN